jgi:hypothetical protein
MAHGTPVSELTWMPFSSRRVDQKNNGIFHSSDPGDVNQDLEMCMRTLGISRSSVAITLSMYRPILAERPCRMAQSSLRPGLDHHWENL